MAPPTSNKQPQGNDNSKKDSGSKRSSSSFNESSPSGREATTSPANIPNPPRSTVTRSRFFPGGQPVPDLIARGYGSNQGALAQATTATQNTRLPQGSQAQTQGSSANQYRPQSFTTNNTTTTTTTDAQQRLQGTRPADTWVTGLPSWRHQNAPPRLPQQPVHPGLARARASYPPQQGQQMPPSTLSPFAREFQSNSQNFSGRAQPGYPILPALPAPPAGRLALPAPPAPPAAPGYSGYAGTAGPTRAAGDYQQNRKSGFRPMQNKLDPEAKNKPLTRAEWEWRRAHGISPNYRGEATNPNNISADIPDHLNCSLFLTNLPPNCTYRDLLSAVAWTQPGRIYATNITPPDASSDRNLPSHRTSAAKVIFYRPEEAARLLFTCEQGLLRVQGYKVRAKRNRVRTPASGKPNTSRCVSIVGRRDFVDEMNLRGIFNANFTFDTDQVILLEEGETWCRLEWRFGSYRAQAESAELLLRKDYSDRCTATFARDPCERTFG
ncbi:hypothetical protein VMCG_03802 [Cytospora schulzeri]|uniref:RRM domain-containing protein n=1 Tax=Cytospora schulzeri TaxID=448051 RepID=A0A423WUM1_9PEZI|nr:hypothetical protein VMCG_03802 [Valsa malicola]